MMKTYDIKVNFEATVEAYSEDQIKDGLSLAITKMLTDIFGYIPSCAHEIESITERIESEE
jgi:hypothetical protein